MEKKHASKVFVAMAFLVGVQTGCGDAPSALTTTSARADNTGLALTASSGTPSGLGMPGDGPVSPTDPGAFSMPDFTAPQLQCLWQNLVPGVAPSVQVLADHMNQFKDALRAAPDAATYAAAHGCAMGGLAPTSPQPLLGITWWTLYKLCTTATGWNVLCKNWVYGATDTTTTTTTTTPQ